MYLKESSMKRWKGWVFFEGKFNEILKGESRGGQDERKFNEINGKVGVCLGESSVRRWKG